MEHEKFPGGGSEGCEGVEWREVERGVWEVVEGRREEGEGTDTINCSA